jgi:hypothetical protein
VLEHGLAKQGTALEVDDQEMILSRMVFVRSQSRGEERRVGGSVYDWSGQQECECMGAVPGGRRGSRNRRRLCRGKEVHDLDLTTI